MDNPHEITKKFEKEISSYTGAPFVCAINSCTNALFLCLKYFDVHYLDLGMSSEYVEIPKRTYVSVAMQIKHAGYKVKFRSERWRGAYQLKPFPIFDCARRFTSSMYKPKTFMCVSFHFAKICGLETGGAILSDSAKADEWFRRARFDGRKEGVAPKDDIFRELGWHMYLNSSTSQLGILKMSSLPKHNADLRNDRYPDLSKAPVFRS